MMTKTAVHEEFFDFCMLDGDDRDELMELFLQACDECDITVTDIDNAVHNWIPYTKDIQYKGVHMAIGALIREFLDIFRLKNRKARGENVKSVYGVLPALLPPYMTVKIAGGDDVYASFPDMVLMNTMQSTFHIDYKMFERAEAAGFNAGARHCALNKVGVAGRLAGVVPDPDVMWSWGLVCDEATKIDEFLKVYTDGNWDSVITRLPHDTSLDEIDYQMPDRNKYLADKLHSSIDKVARCLGVKTNQGHAQKAAQTFNQYMGKLMALALKIGAADPVPMRNSTLSLFFSVASYPYNTSVSYMEAALDTLSAEVDEAIAAGVGVVPKGSPKVGMYFNPSNVPWFDRLLMDNGLVVTMSLPTYPAPSLQAPSVYSDPYQQMAEQWLKMNFGMGCGADIPIWIEKIKTSGVEAVVDGFLGYDRWLSGNLKPAFAAVERELGVPCYEVEADFYDDRDYSEEALRTRVESIAQIIHLNHESFKNDGN